MFCISLLLSVTTPQALFYIAGQVRVEVHIALIAARLIIGKRVSSNGGKHPWLNSWDNHVPKWVGSRFSFDSSRPTETLSALPDACGFSRFCPRPGLTLDPTHDVSKEPKSSIEQTEPFSVTPGRASRPALASHKFRASDRGRRFQQIKQDGEPLA